MPISLITLIGMEMRQTGVEAFQFLSALPQSFTISLMPQYSGSVSCSKSYYLPAYHYSLPLLAVIASFCGQSEQ